MLVATFAPVVAPCVVVAEVTADDPAVAAVSIVTVVVTAVPVDAAVVAATELAAEAAVAEATVPVTLAAAAVATAVDTVMLAWTATAAATTTTTEVFTTCCVVLDTKTLSGGGGEGLGGFVVAIPACGACVPFPGVRNTTPFMETAPNKAPPPMDPRLVRLLKARLEALAGTRPELGVPAVVAVGWRSRLFPPLPLVDL